MEVLQNNRKLDLILEILKLILNILQQIWKGQSRGAFSAEEAAVYLGIEKSTLYKMTSAREIAYNKPNGKLINFAKEDLDAWLRSKRVPTNEELAQQNARSVSFSASKREGGRHDC